MEIASILIKETLTTSELEKLLGVNITLQKSERWSTYRNGGLNPKELLIHTSSGGNMYIQASSDDLNPILDKSGVLAGKEAVVIALSPSKQEHSFVYYEANEISLDYYSASEGWQQVGTKDSGLSSEEEVLNEHAFIMIEYLGEFHDTSTVQVYSFMPTETYDSVSTIDSFYWKKCNAVLSDDQIIENFSYYYLESLENEKSKGYLGFFALILIRDLVASKEDLNRIAEKHSTYLSIKEEVDGLSFNQATDLGESYKNRFTSLSRTEAYKYLILHQRLMRELLKTLKEISGDSEPSTLKTIGSIIVVVLVIIKILSLMSRF